MEIEVVGQEYRRGERDKKAFVVYQLRVRHQQAVWHLGRRYSECAALREWLLDHDEASVEQVDFPSKLSLGAQRYALLSQWMRHVGRHAKGLALVRLSEWLCVDPLPLLLYRSLAPCGSCLLLDAQRVALHPAQVVARAHAVHLESQCPRHGRSSTLYCSDLFFFERSLSWLLPSALRPSPHADVDMEDLSSRMLYRSPEAALPTVMELSLVAAGSSELLPAPQVLEALAKLRKLQGDRRFVVRCAAKASAAHSRFGC